MALESFEDFEQSADSATTAKRIGKLRNEFVDLYDNLKGLLSNAQSQDETNQINETVNTLEDLSNKAHTAAQYTYTPLNELLDLFRAS